MNQAKLPSWLLVAAFAGLALAPGSVADGLTPSWLDNLELAQPLDAPAMLAAQRDGAQAALHAAGVDPTGMFDQRAQHVAAALQLQALLASDTRAVPAAIEVAKLGTLQHAGFAGTLPAAPATPALPSEAAHALLASHGVTPTDAQVATISALNDLDEPLRGAIAGVLHAFLDFQAASRTTFADLDPAMLRALAATPINEVAARDFVGIDFGDIYQARIALLDAVGELHAAQRVPMAATGADVDIPGILAIDLPGGPGPNSTYVDDYAVVIDLEGNDTYNNNAGGSYSPGNAIAGPDQDGGAGFLYDAEGDDVYRAGGGPYYGGSRGKTGGGYLGAGFLFDAAGNDAYLGWASGTNGGGRLGAGFLLDATGDDYYEAASFGTNGGGFYGAGFLLDYAGNDTFKGDSEGSNGGGHIGTGFLLDGSGDDQYIAGGFGANGGANGVYITATLSRGFLLDAAGSDQYIVSRGGANGGGVFGGVGFLFDAEGNDVYDAADLGTNGGGHTGLGFLWDRSGDDRYSALADGTNGGGRTGAGLLLDEAGNDSYQATFGGSNGHGANGVGLLVDVGGTDSYFDYKGGTGTDKTVVPKGVAGAQIDI